jgi:hypothetical protein
MREAGRSSRVGVSASARRQQVKRTIIILPAMLLWWS